MTLKVDKEFVKKKNDYKVIVSYNGQILEVFKMSWLLERMLKEGPQIYPKTIQKILEANGITDHSLEEIDQMLLKNS